MAVDSMSARAAAGVVRAQRWHKRDTAYEAVSLSPAAVRKLHALCEF